MGFIYAKGIKRRPLSKIREELRRAFSFRAIFLHRLSDQEHPGIGGPQSLGIGSEGNPERSGA